MVADAERQQRIFDDFLTTQPSEIRFALWTNRGLGPPIDFVSPTLRIGVELTEWLGQDQSQWVQERDRFRKELIDAIESRNLVNFLPGGVGCTAVINLIAEPPATHDKAAVINDLLDFLVDFEQDHRSQFQTDGIIEVPQTQLPVKLRVRFNAITIIHFPSNNPAVVVQRRKLGFDYAVRQPGDVAIRAFRKILTRKIVEGAEKYLSEKQLLGLGQLWLVVHYSSPGIFLEPMTELGLQIGYGEPRRKSQQAVAAKLRPIAQETGLGSFDRIYFLVDRQPEPFSSELLST
ncbi:MAG: hypothetical protein ACLQDV_21215 [Candidatus Binataceae bacterium]